MKLKLNDTKAHLPKDLSTPLFRDSQSGIYRLEELRFEETLLNLEVGGCLWVFTHQLSSLCQHPSPRGPQRSSKAQNMAIRSIQVTMIPTAIYRP